ncbi:MAG: RING finger protein [Armatimonadota bacterium]
MAPLTTIPTRPGSEYAGKTCPYCQFVIKPGDTVVLCPHCEIPHHEDCWTDNRGCTTFGCAGAEVLAHEPAPSTVGARPLGPPSPAAPYLPGPPGQYVPPQPAPVPGGPYVGPGVQQRLARLRNQAGWSLGLGIFGIFCCPIFVAPLIGLVLGIVALRGYNELRIAHDPGRGQAIAGIVCASVALAAGIFLFIAEATGSFSY